jgi:hypothetical protein
MTTPADRPADPCSFAEPIQDSTPATKEPSERQIEEAAQAVRADTSSKGFNENRFRPRPSYEPSESLPIIESRSPKINWWRPTLALAFAAGLVFIVVSDPSRPLAQTGSLSLAQKRGEPANHEVANLIVNEATPRPVDQPVPLGMSVDNANYLDVLVVFGLPKGTTLSAGHSVGDDGWSLYATDIKDAVIQPPPHFVGVMELTFSLIAAPGFNISDGRPLRFEWVAEKVPGKKLPKETPPVAKVHDEAPAEAKVQDEAPPAAKSRSQTIRQLSPDETAALLKRGNELVASGDLAAARLVLQRAAEAGNARAAFALAGTYNPITLGRLQVHGLSPDLATARHWYERANELGSPDASRELQVLTIRRN